MMQPDYLKWLIKEKDVIFDNGKPLFCYEIDYDGEETILEDWALHIRRHYISDKELEEECEELNIPVEDYLNKYIIPQKTDSMGGTARSNTISEILFSDLLEFVYNYEVPRFRQYNMSGKTLSEHGTDIIGYKFHNSDKKPSEKDKLMAVEVKAQLTSKSTDPIKDAVLDSAKDEYRVSITLNYMRRKLKNLGKTSEAEDVLRFQKKTKEGYNYKLGYIGAGISSLDIIPEKNVNGRTMRVVPDIEGDKLQIKTGTAIFYVHGKKLMDLAHEVYERCKK